MFSYRSLEAARDPAEVCMARICREAGACVKENQLLRDLHIVAQADDQRRIEVIANGLPFWEGKQVAIATTVVSALTGRGVARGRRQGQAIHEAEQDKRRRYPEAHRDQVPFLRGGIRSGRTLEPQRRHVLEELGLVQVSLRAQSPSPFNPTPVLPVLDGFVGLLHPAGLRCQLAGEASGNVRLCERAGGARGRFGPPSIRVRVRYTFIQIRKKKKLIQKHFRPKTLSSKTISSKTEDNFIHDTFIPKRFHPLTPSSKNGFVKRYFRPKPVSSNFVLCLLCVLCCVLLCVVA